VDYFTLEELKAQFKDLLQAYRDYKSLTSESDITAEEREDLKKKADLAGSTFTSSFRDRLAQNPRILLSSPFDHTLDTMMDWASQILPRQGNMQSSFALIEQCSSRLNQLTSETDDAARTSVWPFIRKIRVYLKAHILSKGLIIADLPGMSSSVSIKMKNWHAKLSRCWLQEDQTSPANPTVYSRRIVTLDAVSLSSPLYGVKNHANVGQAFETSTLRVRTLRSAT